MCLLIVLLEFITHLFILERMTKLYSCSGQSCHSDGLIRLLLTFVVPGILAKLTQIVVSSYSYTWATI